MNFKREKNIICAFPRGLIGVNKDNVNQVDHSEVTSVLPKG